jgi:DNA-binding PadR family transcriptional regulator
MPPSRLTTFEHVLLGMIFLQPSTGYELKRRFATTPMGVYQPSSGALYPALDRLERRGLLHSEVLHQADGGRQRRLYHLTEDGRQVHLGWVREPVVPEAVARDLGLHLMRFVMMAHVLPRDIVIDYLVSLRAALAGFVASLEQAAHAADDLYARLAVEHGLAVHQASLAWAEAAIAQLAAGRELRSPGAQNGVGRGADAG